MKNQDYNASIRVHASAEEAFNSINKVADWWSADLEGDSGKLNGGFTVHFGEVFITIKVTRFIPFQEIRWQVIDCNKPWLKNKKEWNGTEMRWEITAAKKTTEINFTHIGLVPGVECYVGCEKAWEFYIKVSLFKLLTAGKGIPELA
jgi:hypothetical protein